MAIDLNAEDYRWLFELPGIGEPVRWFRGLPCPCYNPRGNEYNRNCPLGCQYGHLYTEQTTALNGQPLATLDEDNQKTEGVAPVIQFKKTDIIEAQQGVGILKGIGDATIMAMPDEIPLARPDYFIALSRKAEEFREVIKRQAATYTTHRHVHKILALIGTDGTPLAEGEDYTLTTDSTSGASVIAFPDDAVEVGAQFSIAYFYLPQFWFLGLQSKGARMDAAGVMTPQRGILTLKNPDEFDAA